MDLATIKDISTIAGVLIAVGVYITNSINHYRKTVAENILRLIDAHDRIMKTELVNKHFREIERGTFKRDPNDDQMDQKFLEFIRAVDQVALIHKAKAIPASVDTYIFGWLAQQIQPYILPEERNDIYWSLAIEFIDEMKSLTDDFDKKEKSERVSYFKNLNFYKWNQKRA